MSRARLAAAGAAAALLVGAVAVVGWQDPPSPAASAADPEPRLVLVSGRDDHGMVVHHRVPLYDAAEGSRVVAEVHDATLVEVLAVQGQWLQVTALEGPPATGWVADFYLRGELRLVGDAPSCRSAIGDQSREGGTLVVVREMRGGRVRVESLTSPVVHGWAPRADVQELPPQGARCGDVPPDDRHGHQH